MSYRIYLTLVGSSASSLLLHDERSESCLVLFTGRTAPAATWSKLPQVVAIISSTIVGKAGVTMDMPTIMLSAVYELFRRENDTGGNDFTQIDHKLIGILLYTG